MAEQNLPQKIIHKRSRGPVLVLLSVLPFVYAYVNFRARAFGPLGAVLIMSVIVSGLMALCSLISACTKNSSENPYERLAFHQAKLAGILLMLGFANMLALPSLVGALWHKYHPVPEVLAIVAVPLLWCCFIGVLILLYRLFRPYLLDSGGRVVPDAVVKANVDPHSHWKWWGYYSPEDPELAVERPSPGFGVTLNWARRDNWVVMGFLGAIILFQVVLVALVLLLVQWFGR